MLLIDSFLDADYSPIWSRDTAENMKLWQTAINKLAAKPTAQGVTEGRENAFITLLARYIDEIAKPVADGEKSMSIGMYERNVFTDTLLNLTGWGGHAGNRAIRLADREAMMESFAEKGLRVSGWRGEDTSSFIMRGVVNVGSRKNWLYDKGCNKGGSDT